VRHTGQHGKVGLDVIGAWKDLGIDYPPSDWGAAWELARGHLVEAVNVLREEMSQLT